MNARFSLYRPVVKCCCYNPSFLFHRPKAGQIDRGLNDYVERLWGILENHWKGEILETVDKTIGLARSMTYKGIKPIVRKVTKVYRSGVSLTKKAMKSIEARLERKNGLEWWSINIFPMTGPSTDLG